MKTKGHYKERRASSVDKATNSWMILAAKEQSVLQIIKPGDGHTSISWSPCQTKFIFRAYFSSATILTN